MRRTTSADHAEQVRDDVLRVVRQAFAGGGEVEQPTVTTLARSSAYDPEEIEDALLTLQDVGDVRLGRSGGGVLRVVWVRAVS